jgi:DNA repair protein RecN (Recombination protein N)
LATVAAKAQHHYLIEKKVVERRTETTVREIQGAERVGEIARMLAGGSDDVEARALAARLLTSQ